MFKHINPIRRRNDNLGVTVTIEIPYRWVGGNKAFIYTVFVELTAGDVQRTIKCRAVMSWIYDLAATVSMLGCNVDGNWAIPMTNLSLLAIADDIPASEYVISVINRKFDNRIVNFLFSYSLGNAISKMAYC